MTAKSFLRIVAFNIIVLAGMIFLAMSILEIILRSTTKFDQLASSRPTYIPKKLRALDEEIDRSGETDIWGFRSNDGADQLERLNTKRQNSCRVVILGDSFIWGDGISVGKRWPDLFAKQTDCEIFAFGRNGWTTLEMLAFYEGRLKNKQFDHLIIGYVLNDPHLRQGLDNSYLNLPRGSSFSTFALRPEYLVRARLGITGITTDMPIYGYGILPLSSRLGNKLRSISQPLINRSRAVDFIDQKIYALGNLLPTQVNKRYFKSPLNQTIAWGYLNWREYIYNSSDLWKWRQALRYFKQIKKHNTTFLLTTEDTTSSHLKAHYLAKSLLKAENFDVYDCIKANHSLFKGPTRPRHTWANLADGHPGVEQNKGFASCANEIILSSAKN